MIRLHLLGFTPDLKGLVFSGRRGGRSGTYFVPVDDAFLKALTQLETARLEEDGAEPTSPGAGAKKGKAKSVRTAAGLLEELAPADAAEAAAAAGLAVLDTQDLPPPPRLPRVESQLTPREIQQLLREGRSVAEVASKAEVEPAWIERFLGPILEERVGVVRATRDTFQSRPRLGRSGLPIGRAVRRNLEDRKATDQTLAELNEGWEARRVRARTWRVRLRFTHRGKRRMAEWEFRKDTRGAKPRNKLATDLGWWPPDEQPPVRPAPAADTEELSVEEIAARRAAEATAKKKPKPRKTAKKSSKRSKPSASKKKSTGRKATGAKRRPAGRKTTRRR
jgi:hypothetical protein